MDMLKCCLHHLQDKFGAAPYGFDPKDVQWLVAMLFKLGRVSLTLNSQSLSLLSTNQDELVRYITKREYVEKLLIDIRERATDGQIRSAKEVMKDYFGFTVSSDDDDRIMSSFKSRATVRKYNRNIENAVNNLAAQLRLTEGTDYEKEVRVHDWFCKNVKYDFKGADMDEPARVVLSHNIVGVFAKQKAQCEGIAKAVKVLLNAVDIKCIVATGEAEASGKKEHHAWNVIDIGGSPYQVDVTWDIGASKGRIAYDYFNVTDEIISKTHSFEDEMPKCISLKDNYFERNRLTFRSRSQLIAYITQELEQGRNKLYFRIDGLFPKLRRSELAGMVAKIAAGGQSRAVKVQQIPNEKVGTYWIRIY